MLDIAGLADPSWDDRDPTCGGDDREHGARPCGVPGRFARRVDGRAGADRDGDARAPAAPRRTEITVLGGSTARRCRATSRTGCSRGSAMAATSAASSPRVLAPGGSDGQFTAAIGTPSRRLGAVGATPRRGEWVEVERMPERAALLAALLEDVLRSPEDPRRGLGRRSRPEAPPSDDGAADLAGSLAPGYRPAMVWRMAETEVRSSSASRMAAILSARRRAAADRPRALARLQGEAHPPHAGGNCVDSRVEMAGTPSRPTPEIGQRCRVGDCSHTGQSIYGASVSFASSPLCVAA